MNDYQSQLQAWLLWDSQSSTYKINNPEPPKPSKVSDERMEGHGGAGVVQEVHRMDSLTYEPGPAIEKGSFLIERKAEDGGEG